jgi:ABC-type glycerol-3-phosphate transport system substrate-binding protein
MTEVAHGWAFLVARGRHTVYRTLLAPAFLVSENLQHLLADSAGATGSDADHPQVVEVSDARVGPFSVVSVGELPSRAELEAARSAGSELLADAEGRPLDEHGRPLEIVYGVVSRDRLAAPVDAEDLRIARGQALQSYRRFLADEAGHRVEVAEGFALRTPGHARTPPRASFEAPTPPQPARSEPGRRARRPRATIAGALAAGVALVVMAAVLETSAGDHPPAAVGAAWLDAAPSGAVRLCAVADGTHARQRSVTDFNRRFPRARATLRVMSPAADELRPPYISSLEQGCDVVSVDVTSMPALVARHLLLDMTPYLAPRRAEFNSQMIATVRSGGRSWGVPARLDIGTLYYRADRARRPASWRDVVRQSGRTGARGGPGLRLPIGSLEGRTVVLLELAYAAGAQPIVSADGTRARIDQPAVLDALELLRDARRDGAIPGSDGQTEAGSLSAYELGRASFLRGWPFVSARIRRDAASGSTPATAPARRTASAHTKVTPLPPWKPGGASVGVLGGEDLVIPRAARNPRAALRMVDFLTNAAQVREDALDGAGLPVLTAVATDDAVRKQPLMRAISATKVVARPAIPSYATVSTILARGVAAALDRVADAGSLRSTLASMQREAQAVLDAQQP